MWMEGWVDIMSQKPLATCAYGWGRTLKLYQEYLDVDGMLYALHDLMQMRARYRRTMNISSVRLELQFRERVVTLRGICANKAAELVVSHLKRYCPGATIVLPTMKEQRKQAEKERKRGENTMHYQEKQDDQLRYSEQERSERESALLAETPAWLLELAQDMQRMQARKAQRTQLLHNKEDDLDPNREQLAQHLQADTLPSLTIPVPLRLAPGEQIRYSIDATLCGELLSDGSETPNYTYPPKDQGMLMLTNRRLIYMGRRGQRVLGYARILRISRLRGAIALLTNVTDENGFPLKDGINSQGSASAFHASQRTHQEVFQMSRPLECALYLDHLLRQFYVLAATQHLTAEASPTPSMVPIYNVVEEDIAELANKQADQLEVSQLRQKWSISTRATEKIATTHIVSGSGVTEGIDKYSIQRSLNDIADIETHPLVAIHHVRVS